MISVFGVAISAKGLAAHAQLVGVVRGTDLNKGERLAMLVFIDRSTVSEYICWYHWLTYSMILKRKPRAESSFILAVRRLIWLSGWAGLLYWDC